MSEQQYQGTLASGGTFIADSQGIRILDPGGNQLASFDRQVISGASRDGQIVTVERYNDTIVTLTAASITDAVGLESYVRDVMLAPAEAAPEPPSDEAPAPPVPPSAAAAAAAAAAASPPPPVPPVPPAPSPPTEPPSGETPPLAFDAIDDEGVSEATPEAPADAAPPPPSPVTPIPPIISEPEPSEGLDPATRAEHDLPEPVPTTPPPSTVTSQSIETEPPQTPPPPAAPVASPEEGGGGRRLWLWGCLGCGGLVILAAICVGVLAATGALDDLTDEDATNTPFIIVATEEATATPESDGSEPTATAGEPPSGDVMQPGESGTIDGIQVTYQSARREDSGILPPDEGNEYLILAFEITNTNAEETTISTLLQFGLEDQTGEEFTLALFADIENGLDGELAGGDTIRGEVAFEVPQGSGPFIVSYDDFLSDSPLRWQVT